MDYMHLSTRNTITGLVIYNISYDVMSPILGQSGYGHIGTDPSAPLIR